MLGTEVLEVEKDLDSIVSAMTSEDITEIMKVTGQGTTSSEKVGLPRLSINYDQETEDGMNLKRGDWKMYLDGRFVYASEVVLRTLLRTFEYSMWDAELNEGKGGFSCKSIQKTSFGGAFPDTEGGDKCGRLSRDEENALDKDDPQYLSSRAVVCNQVMYGHISGAFREADGTPVDVVNEPVVAYFKRSGFKPIADFVSSLAKQNKLMVLTEMKLTTSKQKKGSVTYWTPVPSSAGVVKTLTDHDKDLMANFADTIKAHNDTVMGEHREAIKLISSGDDIDLAAEFSNAATG